MNSKGLIFALIGTIAGYFVSNGVEGTLNKRFNPEKEERESDMKEAFTSLFSSKGEDEEEE